MINLRYNVKAIEIKDNGRGMNDEILRNALNYGRLKNRVCDSGEACEKVFCKINVNFRCIRITTA